MSWDAIVTAGGTFLPSSPLFHLCPRGLKTLLPLAGKPMLQWVLDTLNTSSQVRHLVVIGLPPEIPISSPKMISRLPDQGGMLSNIIAGTEAILNNDSTQTTGLIVSSDLPAIQVKMLDWLAQNTPDPSIDLYYTVIEKTVMELHFPTSKRTYLKLKDREVCGGDMHVFRLRAALEKDPLWKQLIDQRKNPLRQAAMVGFDTLFGILTRRLTLDQTVNQVCHRLKLNGRALVSPYPEMGMDVDKPHQYDIMQQELSLRV